MPAAQIIRNIIDKNPANEDGVTPLHFAALYGLQFETCKLIANNIVNKCRGIHTTS